MITVYKLEDFVVSDLFRPFMPDFIEAEYESVEYRNLQKIFEMKFRRKPEIIIPILESMPETKQRVFDRIRKFGGVKFYKYLNIENELIKYVKSNLAERE
jgi:hypothetical protein